MIKTLRKQRGLRQDEFATLLGLSAPHICDIEHDRKLPSLRRLRAFSDVLQIPRVDLLRRILLTGRGATRLRVPKGHEPMAAAVAELLDLRDELSDQDWLELQALLAGFRG